MTTFVCHIVKMSGKALHVFMDLEVVLHVFYVIRN